MKAINDHIQTIKFTLLRFKTNIAMFKQVTPAQIREAEKNLKFMESMINVMTLGMYSAVKRHSENIIFACSS